MEVVADSLVPIQGEEARSDPLLQQVTVLGERGGGIYDVMVPSHLIAYDEVPVNEAHVDELARSMQQEAEAGKGNGSGLLTPVLLGHIDGEATLRIIDGFHRDAALRKNAVDMVFATVRLHSTLEEILDLRILTAKMHSSVTFSRVSKWISEAWANSRWTGQLSVAQAFAITKSDKPKHPGLTDQELVSVKAWVKDKSNRWDMSTEAVHGKLELSEIADPELVRLTRAQPSGSKFVKDSFTFTEQHLGVIARSYPGEYDMQQLVAAVVKRNKMSAKDAQVVVSEVGSATFGEAIKIVETANWAKLLAKKPERAPSRTARLRPSSPAVISQIQEADANESDSARRLEASLIRAEAALARTTLDSLVLRGEYLPPDAKAARTRLLTVNFDDRQLKTITKPVGAAQNKDVLHDITATQASDFASRIQKVDNTISVSDARTMIRNGMSTVSKDIEIGDLRLVRLTPHGGRQLMLNAIRLEMERRRALLRGEAEAAPIVGISEPAILDWDELVQGLAGLSETSRKAAVVHGILGLSLATTALVVDQSVAQLSGQLENVATLLRRSREASVA